MEIKNVRQSLGALCFLFAVGLNACQTSTAPAGSTDAATAGKQRLGHKFLGQGLFMKDILEVIPTAVEGNDACLFFVGFPAQSGYNPVAPL